MLPPRRTILQQDQALPSNTAKLFSAPACVMQGASYTMPGLPLPLFTPMLH